LKEYCPNDEKLLIALHLGLYQLENLQITSKADKKIAARLRSRIELQVKHLTEEVINEVKGYLLEIREREIKTIEGNVIPSTNQARDN